MHNKQQFFVMILFVLLFPPDSALAGGLFGQLVGPSSNLGVAGITDPSPIPRAKIALCPEGSTDPCQNAVTGTDGSFYIPDVPPGSYQVTTPGSNARDVTGKILVPNDLPNNSDFGVTLEAK